ncbi:exodeoxyribonuclease V subunit beta [Pseudoxanthomonas putridarboris]|uniref:RecBCD enzyme subunit RecB n=1 Tax=Pseudoxanthomonas putridarboris TaxID=752605 RepID=A0ABU9IWU8_9GAMM
MSALDLADEPYLTRALEGVQLIEASAGTGKTYTLATLFTRLIVEQRLRMGEVLAVTYTEAATQELRKRIRERLSLAADLAGTAAREDDSHEVALTRRILDRHLAQGGETPAQLGRRLRTAAEETDLAAIFTIHGFCARVLREHALEAGQGFDAGELLGNARELYAELAADLWRVHAADAESADALAGLWSGPDALAADLPALCGPLPLYPQAPADAADPRSDEARPDEARSALADACDRLAAGIVAHGDEYFAQVLAALEAGVLNKTSYKADWLSALQRQLRQWSVRPDPHAALDERIGRLTFDALSAKTNKAHAGKTPVSPLQPLIADYVQALERHAQWRRGQSVRLLHRLRDEARQRLDALKRTRRVQTYDDLIERVAEALEGPRRQALVAKLRAQYRVALVDEFQDTDERQWRIFARVFGDSDEVRAIGDVPALFLIGDPKQAIYGFRGGDVATYLLARRVADEAPRLDHNFRSRPAVLRAIQALYDGADAAGQEAFATPDIRFEPVQAGGRRRDDDCLRDGAPAPALTLRLLQGEDGPLDADASREAATVACVADIHRVLSDARKGHAMVDGRPVQPGDIAVLVRNHKDAARMQQALARAGVPAVAAGKQSLFESAEAGELRMLLLALLQPSDSGRLRAALSTVLLGEDAGAIAALETEGDAQRHHQARLLHWRERWQRGGPFALVSDLCAEQAERLLGLLDGERRLTNYLQLAEHLQEAAARTLGLHGLLDWLQARIASADPNDEAQLLRLESDAHRVQIVTLHKSKGLEYPLVYLPFAGLGTGRPDTGRHRVVHEGDRRVLQWKIDKDDPDWKSAGEAARREAQAEDARLLYVGLTRAEHALWIAAGDVAGFANSRLAPLLADIAALRDHADIRIVEGPAEPPPPRLPAERDAKVAAARTAHRRIAPDWWVYSFTQLAHAEGGADPLAAATEADPGGEDETPATEIDETPTEAAASPIAVDPRFAGSRFGVVMHAALENADFAAWRDWRPGDPAPAGQDAVIADALREGGYAEADIADGLAVLAPLVGHTLGTTLPEGGRLADLPMDARRAEIEFHFAMASTPVPALLALLHRHGLLRGRNAFGMRQRLEGLMTGLIDLTYRADGRWYVLDYKSNQLPGYDEASMRQAMAHSEYDLQALIYTLALHRWLRFRLGEAYDYARDFGGIRYLFCRGLNLAQHPSPGVHAQRFAPELVHALDALFAGSALEPLSPDNPPPLPLAGEGWGEGKQQGGDRA